MDPAQSWNVRESSGRQASLGKCSSAETHRLKTHWLGNQSLEKGENGKAHSREAIAGVKSLPPQNHSRPASRGDTVESPRDRGGRGRNRMSLEGSTDSHTGIKAQHLPQGATGRPRKGFK